jgi:hypothetical protein
VRTSICQGFANVPEACANAELLSCAGGVSPFPPVQPNEGPASDDLYNKLQYVIYVYVRRT